MSESNSLKLSCSCGAQLIFSEIVTRSYYSRLNYEQTTFLKAHEVCRIKQNDSEVVSKILNRKNTSDET